MAYPPQQPGSYGSYDPGGSAPYGAPPPLGYVGPPPPRRRTGLVVGIVIGAVVLIGAGTGAYYLFFRADTGRPGADATPAQVVSGFAQSYTSLAHTLSTDDLARVRTFLCAKDQDAVQVIYDHQKGANGVDASFSMRASGVTVKGDGGTFVIVIDDRGRASAPHRGNLVRQNQRWLVCDTLFPPS
jgi:hypothetical protein